MTQKLLLILFFISFLKFGKSNENSVSVHIKNGLINGETVDFDNKVVNQFLGIPYAEPPVGQLRFKKPVPIEDWSEPLEAKQWPNICAQIHPIPEVFLRQEMSEDCLYLNVWSVVNENQNDDELKPVMFWIHGGALLFGGSHEKNYQGHVLAAKGDIVVVTINYRVGSLGFLYTGTDEAPGNMGLWDQALALEWVNDNIKYFGGDPNRITIFGESAGGWSTSLHILSPVTRNLYQNAIMMSGASINRMAGDEPENILKNWLIGAEYIGCTDGDNKKFTPKIIECLQSAAADKVASMDHAPLLYDNLVGWLSVVVIDGQFLPDRPLKMLESGDFKRNLNLLVGTTEDEGSFVLALIVDPVKHNQFQPQNITYEEAFSELSRISSTLLSKEPINGEDVSKLYFTGLSEQSDQDLLRRTIGLAIGDFLLACPVLQYAKTLYESDKNSKVYQYYYKTKLGKPKLICSDWMGTCHLDDVYSIFGVPFYYPDQHIDREREISAQVIDFFTTFAKTGRPSDQMGAQWPHYYTLNGQTIEPYYEVTNEPKPDTNFGTNLRSDRCKILWKKYIDLQ